MQLITNSILDTDCHPYPEPSIVYSQSVNRPPALHIFCSRRSEDLTFAPSNRKKDIISVMIDRELLKYLLPLRCRCRFPSDRHVSTTSSESLKSQSLELNWIICGIATLPALRHVTVGPSLLVDNRLYSASVDNI